LIYLTIPAGELPHMQLFAKLMIWGHPYMAPLILAGLLALWAVRGAPAKRRKIGLSSPRFRCSPLVACWAT
jgi:hypothetical protein